MLLQQNGMRNLYKLWNFSASLEASLKLHCAVGRLDLLLLVFDHCVPHPTYSVGCHTQEYGGCTFDASKHKEASNLQHTHTHTQRK